MSQVIDLISSREKIIALRKPHWIYLLQGFLWFLFFLIIGLIIDHYLYIYVGSKITHGHSYNLGAISIPPDLFNIDLYFVTFNEEFTPIPWLFGAIGLAILWPYFLIYISHEIALTDKQIIHKKGIIFVDIHQVDLDDIRGAHVEHGAMGWFIGYGSIHLDCRFIDDVFLPAIGDPYQLVKALHNAQYKHPDIEYGEEEFIDNISDIDEHRVKAMRKERKRRLKQKAAMDFRKAQKELKAKSV